METIHSRSYTYIIKNLYSQPSDVFDTIIEDEKIEKRSKSVTKTYDKLINMKIMNGQQIKKLTYTN